MNNPRARMEDLVVERVEEELVVYDERSHMAHALSREAAAVWDACDGSVSAVDIGERIGLDSATVDSALAELREKDLLDETLAVRSGYSRREVTAKFAAIGGAAFAAPFVYSVAVASAQTGCPPCSPPGTTPNCSRVPNTANCATNGVSGAVACDCDCQSGMCYEGTADKRFCVSAGCLPGGTTNVADCTKCCAGVCTPSTTTCASSDPVCPG